MAFVTIPPPGSEFGPCAEPCEHRDCAQSRADAAAVCVYCRRPIGYEVGFVRRSSDDALVHWTCELRSIEAAQAARRAQA